MSPTNLIKPTEMREPRRPDLASVRPLAAVADDEDAHFALGRFNSTVRLARRDAVAAAEEQEVVDQGFHVFFHAGAGRGGDFVVFGADGAGGHFVEALVDYAEGLAEFFHAAVEGRRVSMRREGGKGERWR